MLSKKLHDAAHAANVELSMTQKIKEVSGNIDGVRLLVQAAQDAVDAATEIDADAAQEVSLTTLKSKLC